MFRLRSKSGDESVFRTPEEIRSALLSGFVTPDAQIWDAALKGWVPLLEHPLYQQIAAAPPGRKSNSVKAPPSGTTKAMPPVTPPTSSPTTAKPVQKLVIRRPGEEAKPAAPATPATPVTPPTPPAKPADEVPELEMIDVDLSMDEESLPEPTSAPAPLPPPPPPAPPRRPTPPPAPVAETPAPTPAPRPSTPRVSAPRVTAPREVPEEPRPAMQSMEAMGSGGSKKGLAIGAVVVILVAGGAFFGLRGRLGGSSAAPDSTVTPRVAVVDSTPDTTATPAPDTTTPPSAPVAAPVDTTPVIAPAPIAVSQPDTTPATAAVPPVQFAPTVDRGATSWNSRAPGGPALSIPDLESVRLRYLAAQGRALEQFEAGLQASGFSDMFAPSKVANQDRRSEALDAVDAARSALNEFRRRQAAIDFAYRDTLRAALPAGSDDPDLRTFGPLLRETPAQVALTDSLVAEMAEAYGTLVRESGNYALRGRELVFKDQPTADRYREQQEKLTAQMARIRRLSPSEVPPAMAGILRGIGLPR